MKKGLSLLLAASVAFSAFSATAFAATPQTAEEKYQALVEAGIFEGFPDGQAHLDQNMTRAQAAKIVAVLLGLEENAAAASIYKDLKGAEWAAGYIGAATEAGILEGRGNGVFDPSANVTIQELAKIMVEAIGLEVDATATAEGADEWAQAYVAAAVKAGLIPQQSDYTAPASRTILVEASYSAYEAAQEDEVATFAAQATGAKKITVNFGKAVDTTKVALTVKKGTISVNVAKTTFAEDKKSAVVELSGKLTEGDYTVSATGVEAEALTATIKAENEKVTKIEFSSNVAPLAEVAGGDGVNDLKIPYKVLNQYGENITKTTSLTSNFPSGTAMGQANINQNSGVVEIVGTYKINDAVAVTLIHAETGTSAVQTFTVGAEAKVAEIAITGLYNSGNKTLNEDIDLTVDRFYLVLEAKDQYGNPITNKTKVTNDLVAPSNTNSGVVTLGAIDTLDIDGETKVVLPLANPTTPTGATKAGVGTSTVMLISNTSAKSASFNVVVAEAARIDTLNLINPGLIVADEDNYIPVEAYDKDGNLITDLNTLNNQTKGIRTLNFNGVDLFAGGAKPFENKDGIVQIKIPSGTVGSTKGLKSIVAMTSSYKSVNLTVDVKEKAIPTTVVGTDADFGKTLKTTKTSTIGVSNLVIEDQYGRVMSDSAVNTYLATEDWKIFVTQQSAEATSAIGLTGTAATVNGTNGFVIDNGNVAVTVSGDNKGYERITMVLTNGNSVKSASTVDVSLRVTDGTEYVSYTADTIGMVYDETANGRTDAEGKYDKEIKVYGVLSDGSKVKLDVNDEYTVSSVTNATVSTDVYDGTFNVATSPVTYGAAGSATEKEVTVPVVITIGKTAEEIKQDVKISKAAPKVASVAFVKSNATNADTTTSKTITAGANFSIADLTAGANNTNIMVTDQYGVKVIAAAGGAVTFPDGTTVAAPTITVKPVVGSVTTTANGLSTATVTGTTIAAYEEFDVTVTYAGGASATIRVKAN